MEFNNFTNYVKLYSNLVYDLPSAYVNTNLFILKLTAEIE